MAASLSGQGSAYGYYEASAQSAGWLIAARALLGVSGAAIERVVATHCHPDHLGNAAWLAERFGSADRRRLQRQHRTQAGFDQLDELVRYCGIVPYVTFAEISRLDTTTVERLKRLQPAQ